MNLKCEADMPANKYDLAVINGLLVNGQGVSRGDILISGGKVAEIAPAGSGAEADRVMDAGSKYILPGIIDAHLHPVYADHMDTLSRAAATEGVTCLIPYVGAVKAWGQEGGLIESLDAFIKESEETSLVDFSLHCTVMQEDIKDMAGTVPALIQRGITSFKGFMAYAKRGMKLADRELLDLMGIIAGHGGLFAAHAENGDVIDYLEDHHIARGKEGPEFYPPTHPGICEAEAVFRLLSLAQVAGCPVYIPHISSALTLDVLRLFRGYGAPDFYAETCPHYLCLNDGLMKKYGSLAKMSPPLRKEVDNIALWRAVADGLIQVVASDHAASAQEKNEPIWDKVFQAPNGIPGMETMLKAMYGQGVNQGLITLPGLVRSLCENPARIFGLYPQKGVLEKGSDADLVIFDPSAPYEVTKRHPELNIEYTIFEGMKGLGAPEATISRGEVIFENEKVCGQAGRGGFLAARPHNK